MENKPEKPDHTTGVCAHRLTNLGEDESGNPGHVSSTAGGLLHENSLGSLQFCYHISSLRNEKKNTQQQQQQQQSKKQNQMRGMHACKDWPMKIEILLSSFYCRNWSCFWYIARCQMWPSSNVEPFMRRTQCKLAQTTAFVHLHWVQHMKSSTLVCHLRGLV